MFISLIDSVVIEFDDFGVDDFVDELLAFFDILGLELLFVVNDMVDFGDDLDFLFDEDEVFIKFDLVCVYIDMGDREGVKDIFDEVMIEGNDS